MPIAPAQKQTDRYRSMLVDGPSSTQGISVRNVFIMASCLTISFLVVGVGARHISEDASHASAAIDATAQIPHLRHSANCSKVVQFQSQLRPVWIKANDHFKDQTPENAIDGNATTKWHTAGSSGWLSFALAPGQAAALTRVEFKMSEKNWSARWPGHITVYGFNVTFPIVYSTNNEASWTRLWSSSPQWNGTTGISSRPNTSETQTPSNAFKIKLHNRYPDGNHGWPHADNFWSNRLVVHDMVLIGTLPKRITYPCSSENY
jgi:hypothetical protein